MVVPDGAGEAVTGRAAVQPACDPELPPLGRDVTVATSSESYWSESGAQTGLVFGSCGPPFGIVVEE